MPFIINLIFLFLPFLFTSCQSNSLIGEWVYEGAAENTVVKVSCTFFKDKTYWKIFNVNGRIMNNDDGTYTQEGDMIILKPRFSDVIKLRRSGSKLLLPMQTGGGYTPLQTFDIPLSKKK